MRNIGREMLMNNLSKENLINNYYGFQRFCYISLRLVCTLRKKKHP